MKLFTVLEQAFLRAIFALLFVSSATLVANAESIGLKALDTIAGYATHIETSEITAFEDINIRVEKPDGSVVTVPARTDASGIASINFDGYHTKKVGLYSVSSALLNKDYGASKRFQVFPDIFSSTKSSIVTDTASIAENKELTVRVYVKDKYDNPISQQFIKLFSSRANDIIRTENNGVTNEKGLVVFYVQAQEAGVSVLTAMNTSLGQEIYERKKIIFFQKEEAFSIGGDMFSASLTNTQTQSNTFGVLDHFELSFPQEVLINDDQNHLKIIAKDADGNTVKAYTGTIRIAVEGDDNAIIPSEGEYTFSSTDQGEKAFALAMIFTSVGDKKIQVFDVEADGSVNTQFSGQTTVHVIEKQQEEAQVITSSDIAIKAPVNGSELSSSTIMVSGLAVANTNLKLMLDDMKMADVEVDAEGFFTATLQAVEDGRHELYVMESEGLRRASDAVNIVIDATAPRIEGQVKIFPEDEVFLEKDYTVTVYSEAGLEYVNIQVAGMEETLTESSVNPGKYEVTLVAPQNPGEYNISVTMSDKMGNDAEYRNQAILKAEEEIIIRPSKSSTPLITAKDAQLDITWTATESQNPIDHYNVYVGTNAQNLLLATQVKTLSAVLKNLENSTEYFVAISALDSEGQEGEQSDIVKAEPKAKVAVVVESTHPAATQMPLRVLEGDSKVTLSWDGFPEADHYKVFFGIKAKNYEVELVTEDTSTSLVVPDLINNLKYYFTVQAFNTAGFAISENYPEVSAKPTGFGFIVKPSAKKIPTALLKDYSQSKVIKGQTGPAEVALIAIIVSFLLGLILFKLRRSPVTMPPVIILKKGQMQF